MPSLSTIEYLLPLPKEPTGNLGSEYEIPYLIPTNISTAEYSFRNVPQNGCVLCRKQFNAKHIDQSGGYCLAHPGYNNSVNFRKYYPTVDDLRSGKFFRPNVQGVLDIPAFLRMAQTIIHKIYYVLMGVIGSGEITGDQAGGQFGRNWYFRVHSISGRQLVLYTDELDPGEIPASGGFTALQPGDLVEFQSPSVYSGRFSAFIESLPYTNLVESKQSTFTVTLDRSVSNAFTNRTNGTKIPTRDLIVAIKRHEREPIPWVQAQPADFHLGYKITLSFDPRRTDLRGWQLLTGRRDFVFTRPVFLNTVTGISEFSIAKREGILAVTELPAIQVDGPIDALFEPPEQDFPWVGYNPRKILISPVDTTFSRLVFYTGNRLFVDPIVFTVDVDETVGIMAFRPTNTAGYTVEYEFLSEHKLQVTLTPTPELSFGVYLVVGEVGFSARNDFIGADTAIALPSKHFASAIDAEANQCVKTYEIKTYNSARPDMGETVLHWFDNYWPEGPIRILQVVPTTGPTSMPIWVSYLDANWVFREGWDKFLSVETKITITYYYAANEGEGGPRLRTTVPAKCRHARRDFSDTYGITSDIHASGGKFYCARRKINYQEHYTDSNGDPYYLWRTKNVNGFKTFSPRCYQPGTCEGFEPVDVNQDILTKERLTDAWHQFWANGCVVMVVMGLTSGPDSFYYMMTGAPSIPYLTSTYRLQLGMAEARSSVPYPQDFGIAGRFTTDRKQEIEIIGEWWDDATYIPRTTGARNTFRQGFWALEEWEPLNPQDPPPKGLSSLAFNDSGRYVAHKQANLTTIEDPSRERISSGMLRENSGFYIETHNPRGFDISRVSRSTQVKAANCLLPSIMWSADPQFFESGRTVFEYAEFDEKFRPIRKDEDGVQIFPTVYKARIKLGKWTTEKNWGKSYPPDKELHTAQIVSAKDLGNGIIEVELRNKGVQGQYSFSDGVSVYIYTVWFAMGGTNVPLPDYAKPTSPSLGGNMVVKGPGFGVREGWVAKMEFRDGDFKTDEFTTRNFYVDKAIPAAGGKDNWISDEQLRGISYPLELYVYDQMPQTPSGDIRFTLIEGQYIPWVNYTVRVINKNAQMVGDIAFVRVYSASWASNPKFFPVSQPDHLLTDSVIGLGKNQYSWNQKIRYGIAYGGIAVYSEIFFSRFNCADDAVYYDNDEVQHVGVGTTDIINNPVPTVAEHQVFVENFTNRNIRMVPNNALVPSVPTGEELAKNYVYTKIVAPKIRFPANASPVKIHAVRVFRDLPPLLGYFEVFPGGILQLLSEWSSKITLERLNHLDENGYIKIPRNMTDPMGFDDPFDVNEQTNFYNSWVGNWPGDMFYYCRKIRDAYGDEVVEMIMPPHAGGHYVEIDYEYEITALGSSKDYYTNFVSRVAGMPLTFSSWGNRRDIIHLRDDPDKFLSKHFRQLIRKTIVFHMDGRLSPETPHPILSKDTRGNLQTNFDPIDPETFVVKSWADGEIFIKKEKVEELKEEYPPSTLCLSVVADRLRCDNEVQIKDFDAVRKGISLLSGTTRVVVAQSTGWDWVVINQASTEVADPADPEGTDMPYYNLNKNTGVFHTVIGSLANFYMGYTLGATFGGEFGSEISIASEVLACRQGVLQLGEALARFPNGTIIKKATATVGFSGLQAHYTVGRVGLIQIGKDFYGDPIYATGQTISHSETETGALKLKVVGFNERVAEEIPHYQVSLKPTADEVIMGSRFGRFTDIGDEVSVGSFSVDNQIKENVDITEIVRGCLSGRSMNYSYVGIMLAPELWEVEGNLPGKYTARKAGEANVIPDGPFVSNEITASSFSIYDIRVEYEMPREFFLKNIFYGNMPSVRP